MRETARAKKAYADYLAMGPHRSMEKLIERYLADPARTPTVRLNTLKTWSARYHWADRIMGYLDQEEAAAAEAEQGRIKEILSSGYALSHNRVKDLQALAERLFSDLMTQGKGSRLWLKERQIKLVPTGKRSEREKLEWYVLRFNHHEVEQYRGLLDDIAKETGGRVVQTERSIKREAQKIAKELGLADDDVPEIIELAKRLANSGDE